MNRVRAVPALLVDFVIATLGVWQLLASGAIRLGCDFDTVVAGAVLAPFLAIALWMALPRTVHPVPVHPLHPLHPVPPETESPPSPLPRWAPWTAVAVAAGVCAWQVGLPYVVAWAAGVAHLFATADRRSAPSIDVDLRASRTELLVLAGCCLLASLATLSIHRPDRDDAYYFNEVVATLAHPELPVLSFDGMHGDVTWPLQQVAHRAQSYELLVAVLARLTGIVPGTLYWVVLPALIAWLVVLANWMLSRAVLGPRAAPLATLLLVVLLVAWGGHYVTHANFAFSRLFQGKSAFVSVVVPYLVVAALRFAARPDGRSFAALLLGQCAGAVFSSTALLIGPLAVGVATLGTFRPSSRWWFGALGAGASSLPMLAMLALVQRDVSLAGGMAAEGKTLSWEHVLEPGWRGGIAVFLLVSMPMLGRLAQVPGAIWLERYVTAGFVLLLNGQVANALTPFLGNLFSWRLYWFLPLPALVAGAFSLAALAAVRRPGAHLAWLLLLGGFLAAGPWTFSASNLASLRFAEWKVEPAEFAVATHVVESTGPADVVLAHPYVASRITAFPSAPRLIAVRPNYAQNLARHLGAGEAGLREHLLEFAKSGKDVAESRVVPLLDERCVSVFVVAAAVHDRQPSLTTRLEGAGFVRIDVEGYAVWQRSPPC